MVKNHEIKTIFYDIVAHGFLTENIIQPTTHEYYHSKLILSIEYHHVRAIK